METTEEGASSGASGVAGWMSGEFEMQMNPKSVFALVLCGITAFCRACSPTCQSSTNSLSHFSPQPILLFFFLLPFLFLYLFAGFGLPSFESHTEGAAFVSAGCSTQSAVTTKINL